MSESLGRGVMLSTSKSMAELVKVIGSMTKEDRRQSTSLGDPLPPREMSKFLLIP
jgi:hypothetical protein